MKNKINYFSVLIGTLLMISSCTNSTTKSDGSSEGSAGVASTILSAANSALESSGNLMDPASSLRANINSGVRVDPCPNFGNNANDTADSIYCMISSNSGSPETARGALSLISQIVSGIESQIDLVYSNTPTDHENLSFSVTTSDGPTAVVASIRERALTNDIWDKKIDICILSFNGQTMSSSITDCVNGRFFYTIYLAQTEEILAFKGVQRMDYPLIETVLFHLNKSSGELRYNSWSLENGNQHRYYVQGTFSDAFEMTTLNKAAFAHGRATYDDNESPTSIANWSAAYAFYNGTDLCINYQNSNPADNEWTISGDCTGKMPEYNTGFHAFLTQTSAINTFAEDETKGILNFDETSFSISSFFIDN